MPATLRGVTWDHPRGHDSIVAASAEWARNQDDVRVDWTARSLQAFADQPLDDLARNYDLIVMDHPHIPLVAAEGCLLRLDGADLHTDVQLSAPDFVGPSYETYEHDGRLFALPIDAAAQVGVHRPDLLPDPPSTWDDVLAFAADGRMLWPAKPVDAISSFLTVAANRGTPVAEGADEFIGVEDGLAVFDLLHKLADSVPDWCLAANPIEVAEALCGDDGFCYAPLAFGYTNYSRPGFRPRRLRYIDIPSGRRQVSGSCLGGAGIAVSAYSEHADVAVRLAYWLAGRSSQTGPYYWSGGQPAHCAAWDDDDINRDCLDFFRNTRATLDGAWVRPRYAGWLDLQDVGGDIVVAALRREISDDAALRKLDEAYLRSVEPAALAAEGGS